MAVRYRGDQTWPNTKNFGGRTPGYSRRTIGWLYKGDCFGEIGFLTHQKRTATIIAKSSLTLMKLNATVMEQVSESGQLRFYKAFTEALIKRLSQTNKQLTEASGQS